MIRKQWMLLKISLPLLLVLLIVSVTLTFMKSNTQNAQAAGALLSQNHPVTASSTGVNNNSGCCGVAGAVDGSTSTRWASAANIDPSWIYVDLSTTAQISEISADLGSVLCNRVPAPNLQ